MRGVNTMTMMYGDDGNFYDVSNFKVEMLEGGADKERTIEDCVISRSMLSIDDMTSSAPTNRYE